MALLVPAILAKSAHSFQEKLNLVSPYCPKIQVDIMDGIFVNNKTIQYQDIPQVAENIKLELHMMTKDPLSIFQYPKHPAVTTFIFHYEAVADPISVLNSIPKKIIRGIAINPETPTKVLEPLSKYVDMILLMSVAPGFDNQPFNPKVIEKIGEIKALRPGLIIEMDGGINKDNASTVSAAGIDQAVVGSELFESHNIKHTITDLMLDLGDMRGVGA